LRKPLPTPTDQMAFKERFNKNIEGGPRPTMKKTYRYIPHEQGRESDPIFHRIRGFFLNDHRERYVVKRLKGEERFLFLRILPGTDPVEAGWGL